MIMWFESPARWLLPVACACLFQGFGGLAPRELSAEGEAARALEPLRVERGEGELALLVPRDEELVYKVTLNFGWLGDPVVGTVTLTSRVSPYQADLMLLGSHPDKVLEMACIEAHAVGGYAVYEVDDRISCTVLPQDWPSLIHRSVQAGTENRKREVMVGLVDGSPRSQYRKDAHCDGCDDRAHFVKPTWAWQKEHHCKDCKRAEHRVWREPKSRGVPPGTVDMVGAVYLARSMLQLGEDKARFHLIDRDELWIVDIARGEARELKLPAGRFAATLIDLHTEVPESETKRKDEQFSGLFGIHGTLSIWMQTQTGVPVLIRGVVPVGPIDIDVSIELVSYRGTPPGFAPR